MSTLLDWQYNNFLCVTIKKIISFNFCRETPKSEKKKKKKKKRKREREAEDMDATATSEALDTTIEGAELDDSAMATPKPKKKKKSKKHSVEEDNWWLFCYPILFLSMIHCTMVLVHTVTIMETEAHARAHDYWIGR